MMKNNANRNKLKPKHRRLVFIGAGLLSVAIAVSIILSLFRDNLVFYYSPYDLFTKKDDIKPEQRIRLGGLVKQGSIVKSGDGVSIQFAITDITATATVEYYGLLPMMFREGQGVVAEGYMEKNGLFKADRLLIKHDEKYMPSEVIKSVKKSGQWKGE